MIYLTRIRPDAPPPGEGVRLAIFQAERPVGTREAVHENLVRLSRAVQEAKKFDAQLISFPELYVEGYTMTPEVAHRLAEPADGPSMARVGEIAEEHSIGIICPYAEKEGRADGDRYYDSIAFFGPDGTMLHNYRKTHLFGLAERDNYSFGYTDGDADPFKVSDINGIGIGILNCYEAEFFELTRILALTGAKLVVIPTAADFYYNLSDGTRTVVPYPDITRNLIPAHAYENNCFVSYCNRAGTETVGPGTWRYRGNSIIVGPHGDIMVAARNEDTLLVGDCIPGDYGPTHPEGNYLRNRRPELYGKLVSMEIEAEDGYRYSTPPRQDTDM
jgi:predicted amidohydrolase